MRRALIVLLGALLFAAPAAAQEPSDAELKARWERLSPEERKEKLRLYDQLWCRLSPEERARRLAFFEERLKGLTPAQREQLLVKLRDLKRRRDVEKLRRNHERSLQFERHFFGQLDPGLRDRLQRMPVEQRHALARFAFQRTAEILRDRVLEWLAPEERQEVLSSRGSDRLRRLEELERNLALKALHPEQRAAIAALPEAERQEWMKTLVKRARAEQAEKVRSEVEAELTSLLELPPEQVNSQILSARVLHLVGELGAADPDQRARLSRLTPAQLKTLVGELKAAATLEKRRERLKTFLAALPD